MKKKENQCPICGKAGISDYKKEAITCPACNTDLSIYRIITTINRNQKVWKILLGISAIVIVSLLLGESYLSENEIKSHSKTI